MKFGTQSQNVGWQRFSHGQGGPDVRCRFLIGARAPEIRGTPFNMGADRLHTCVSNAAIRYAYRLRLEKHEKPYYVITTAQCWRGYPVSRAPDVLFEFWKVHVIRLGILRRIALHDFQKLQTVSKFCQKTKKVISKFAHWLRFVWPGRLPWKWCQTKGLGLI